MELYIIAVHSKQKQQQQQQLKFEIEHLFWLIGAITISTISKCCRLVFHPHPMLIIVLFWLLLIMKVIE